MEELHVLVGRSSEDDLQGPVKRSARLRVNIKIQVGQNSTWHTCIKEIDNVLEYINKYLP